MRSMPVIPFLPLAAYEVMRFGHRCGVQRGELHSELSEEVREPRVIVSEPREVGAVYAFDDR